jgi:hypothetical protein
MSTAFTNNFRQFWRTLFPGALVFAIFGQLSVLSAPNSPIPNQSSPKYTTSIKLVQRSRLNGDEFVYLSPFGIRIENPRSHIVIFAKPPEWTVYKLSQETKKYTVVPFQSFNNPMLRAQVFAAGINMSGATCIKTGTSKMFELPVDLYASDDTYVKSASESYHKAKVVSANYPETFKLKTFARSTFPPEEAHMLAILNGMPDLHAVPIEMVYSSFEKKIVKYLSTVDATSVTLSAEQLTLPNGMQKVTADSALTTSVEVQKDMLDFIESAGQRKSHTRD